MFSEARLCTLAAAVASRIDQDASAFAVLTATALHGLPVYASRGDRVDLVVRGQHTRHSAPDVRRHQWPLPADDVVDINGLRVTSLARTLYDVIRLCSLEAALIAMDAALHRVAWNDDDNTYDEDLAQALTAAIEARVAAHPGARGIRQGRFVLEFADGRAQSPGESLARLRMWQLQLPAPILQLRVGLPGGRYALLDLALPGLERWLEFDGAVKYSDPRMLAGRTPDEVRSDEAQRQDAVERVTGWDCDRMGWEHVASLDAFVAFRRTINLYP